MMTATERMRLPVYDWRAQDVGRSMRLLRDGNHVSANANGWWRCSCGAWGRSMDEGTAKMSGDSHAAKAHNEEVLI